MSEDGENGAGPEDPLGDEGDFSLEAPVGDDVLPVETDGGHDVAGGLEMDDLQAREIRHIFLTTLPQYLEPVEEMVELLFSGDEPDAETLQALDVTLSSIGAAASRIGVEDVSACVVRIRDALANAGSGSAPARGDLRERIDRDLGEIERLASGAPGRPAEPTRSGRAQTIFSALKGCEGVDEKVLERLTAAGLVSVDQLLGAKLDEIVAVSGLDAAVVERVLALVAGGREAAAPPDRADEAVDAAPDEPAPAGDRLGRELRALVEAEMSLEEIRPIVVRLRARAVELRRELSSARRRRDELLEEIASVGNDLATRVATLRDRRAFREELAGRKAAAEQALGDQERRIADVEKEREVAVDEHGRLTRQVEGLVERVQRMLRSASRGRGDHRRPRG